jgi:hypothetical protein
MSRRWFLALSLCLLAACAVARDDAYLAELIQQAHNKHLAEREEWHSLLHYKPNLLLPGVHSLADDPEFFNAEDGKENPESELDATLESFFSTQEQTETSQHPQCAFIARYHWLQQELNFDSRRLTKQRCKHFNEWRKGLNPQELTLVFPSAYLNNPSSMYGHTLLRIDAKDQDERTRLLAYAINYAAPAGADNGVTFAIKGLLGGYAGEFSLMPYYMKVREYTDLENRDIWEYRLNFTPEEIDRLLMHAWELAPIYFDYYFFDENCAYHLLSLFDVARPGLNLTDRFRWWALPVDTVRATVEQEGLLKEVVYRPASSTILHYRMASMSLEQLRWAKKLISGDASFDDVQAQAFSQEESVEVLEFAQGYLSYLTASGKRKHADDNRLAHDLLTARSRINQISAPPQIPTLAVRPDQGHPTSRLALGAGKEDGRHFIEFRIRPTYHDLLDPQSGYVRGAEINFFSLRLRHLENSSIRLEEFIPIDIVSLSPIDPFFKPVSWKLNVAAVRKHLPDYHEPLVFRLNGGVGFSFDVGDTALIYCMLESTLDVGNGHDKDYALAAGPSVGWLQDLTSRWRFHLFARTQRFGLGDSHTAHALVFEQRVSLTKQTAIRLSLSRESEFDRYWNSGELAWHYYF